MSPALAVSLLAAASAQEPAPVSDTDALRAETEALRAELARTRAELAALERGLASDRPEDGARTSFGRAVTVIAGETVTEAVSFGSDVNVSGRVLGDAVSFGGDVRVAPTGRVHGDAVSFGGCVVVLDGGAVTGDQVAMDMPAIGGLVTAPVPGPQRSVEAPIGTGTVLSMPSPIGDLFGALRRKLVWLLSLSGAGVLVVGLFPNRVGRVARDLEERPVRAAVVGILASSFLLLFSLLFTLLTLGLGLPIGALLVALLGCAWLLGFVALCQAVGDRLPFDDRPYGRWLAFLVAVGSLAFLGSLPWVGWLVVGSASLLGIGSALATRFGRT